MTPNQARAARAYLNLDMVTVCMLVPIGKRTLTEFERGSRNISDTTLSRLIAFYNVRGIVFGSQLDGNSISSIRTEAIQDVKIDYKVNQKLEYDNRFGINDIFSAVDSLKNLCVSCSRAVNFSRDTVIHAMSLMNFNQKQLSHYLGCSPAFISAVILQKKMLSVDIAILLESRLGLRGISQMILSEKRIKKSIDSIQKEAILIESEIELTRKRMNKS